MQKWVINRITLHNADQEEIDKVKDFLRSENSEVDFNNIIPIPKEIRKTMSERCTVDYAWEYYQAKEFGDYTEIDKMLNYAWVKRECIETRSELLGYLLRKRLIFTSMANIFTILKKSMDVMTGIVRIGELIGMPAMQGEKGTLLYLRLPAMECQS